MDSSLTVYKVSNFLFLHCILLLDSEGFFFAGIRFRGIALLLVAANLKADSILVGLTSGSSRCMSDLSTLTIILSALNCVSLRIYFMDRTRIKMDLTVAAIANTLSHWD